MARFESQDWLPDEPTISSIIDTSVDEVVPRLLKRVLVEPAISLAARPSKRIRAKLVVLSARLSKGDVINETAVAACAAAIELLHAGSLIIDDVQDGSVVRRGALAMHLEYGIPRALCTGNWLYFWPLRIIREARLAPEQELYACRIYLDAVERAHYGQALDLSVRADQLSQQEVITLANAALQLKTGAITALAMSLGASVGGMAPSDLAHVAAFGQKFGVTLQSLDDFGNLIGGAHPEKRREDLYQSKLSGVWLQVARRSNASVFSTFQAVVRRLQAGDERPLDEFIASHGLIDTAITDARSELQASFDELSDALGLSQDTPIICELKCLAEDLIHAYF